MKNEEDVNTDYHDLKCRACGRIGMNVIVQEEKVKVVICKCGNDLKVIE